LLAYSSGDDILVPSHASRRIVDRLAPDNEGIEYSSNWGGHACNVTDFESFNRIVPHWLESGTLPPDLAKE
jgi:aminoacrylate hydrolase